MTILIFVPVNDYDVPPGMAAPEREAPTQEEAGPTQEEAGPTGATGCGISQEEVDDATSQEDHIHYLEGAISRYRDEAFASERTIDDLTNQLSEEKKETKRLRDYRSFALETAKTQVKELNAKQDTITTLRNNNNEYRTTITLLRKAMEASIDGLSAELDDWE